jgi:hypothetical protein
MDFFFLCCPMYVLVENAADDVTFTVAALVPVAGMCSL